MCLAMCREQSPLTKETRVDKMPSIAKKRPLRKHFTQRSMSDLQKNKSMQTGDSVFAEKIKKAKKTKFELELIKVVDCFLDGHGNYDSKLVPFKIKFLQQTIFFYYS